MGGRSLTIGATRRALLERWLVALAVAGCWVAACRPAAQRENVAYGGVAVLSDGASGATWLAAFTPRFGGGSSGIVGVAGRRAYRYGPSSGLGGRSLELLPIDRDTVLWVARERLGTRGVAAIWSPRKGFSATTELAPLAASGSSGWCCRITPLDQSAKYALGGRYRDDGKWLPWVQTRTFAAEERVTAVSPSDGWRSLIDLSSPRPCTSA